MACSVLTLQQASGGLKARRNSVPGWATGSPVHKGANFWKAPTGIERRAKETTLSWRFYWAAD